MGELLGATCLAPGLIDVFLVFAASQPLQSGSRSFSLGGATCPAQGLMPVFLMFATLGDKHKGSQIMGHREINFTFARDIFKISEIFLKSLRDFTCVRLCVCYVCHLPSTHNGGGLRPYPFWIPLWVLGRWQT